MTQDIKAGAREIAESIIEPCMLDGWAASAAATELVDNWLQAIADGSNVSQLLGDVDDTIAELMRFRAYVRKNGLNKRDDA